MPAAARATRTVLWSLKAEKGLAELADELHRPTWSSDQERVKPGELAGEEAKSSKWELVGGRMDTGSKRTYLAGDGDEGG